jgi:hypothetical protein
VIKYLLDIMTLMGLGNKVIFIKKSTKTTPVSCHVVLDRDLKTVRITVHRLVSSCLAAALSRPCLGPRIAAASPRPCLTSPLSRRTTAPLLLEIILTLISIFVELSE